MKFISKRRKLGPVAEAIIASLEGHPEKWRLDEYHLFIGDQRAYDAPVTIWIGNGMDHLKVKKPAEIKLYDNDRKQLWEAIERWKAGGFCIRQFVETLNAAEAK